MGRAPRDGSVPWTVPALLWPQDHTEVLRFCCPEVPNATRRAVTGLQKTPPVPGEPRHRPSAHREGILPQKGCSCYRTPTAQQWIQQC